MKAVFQKSPFESAFKIAAKAVAVRDPKPVLTQVLLSVEGDGAARLTGNDYEVAVEAETECISLKSPGKVLLPPKRTAAFLDAVSGDIEMEAMDDRVSLRSGSAKAVFNTMKHDDFPEFPDFPKVPKPYSVGVAAAGFQTAVRRVVPAADDGASNFSLCGVNFEIQGGQIFCVATDGRVVHVQRLAVASATDEQADGHADEDKVRSLGIFPAKAIQMIASACDKETLNLKVGKNMAVFETKGLRIATRLIEGRYPNWRKVVRDHPEEGDYSQAPVAEFISAVKTASIVSDERQPIIVITIDNGRVSFRSVASESGESETSFPIAPTPDLRTARYDAAFVAQALRCIGGETVFFRLPKEIAFEQDGKTFYGSDGPMFLWGDDGFDAAIMGMNYRKDAKPENGK